MGLSRLPSFLWPICQTVTTTTRNQITTTQEPWTLRLRLEKIISEQQTLMIWNVQDIGSILSGVSKTESIEEDRGVTCTDIKLIMPTVLILLFTLFIMVTVIPYAFSSVIKQLQAVWALEERCKWQRDKLILMFVLVHNKIQNVDNCSIVHRKGRKTKNIFYRLSSTLYNIPDLKQMSFSTFALFAVDNIFWLLLFRCSTSFQNGKHGICWRIGLWGKTWFAFE